ncbi:MAG: Flp pilus assembly protein CpaB [Rhizobiaceae bacterium]
MKGKLVPMVGLAVVFGALSIFVADRFVKSQTPAAQPLAVESANANQPSIETKKILVASTALKFGMEVTPETVQEVDWPANSLPVGSFSSLSELTDGGKRVVLSPMAANEPVLLAKLSGKDGRASLSNLLEPGMRAVSIRVDDITGVAGFVTPGDRVDVLLTRQKTNVQQQSNSEEVTAATPTSELASEVILQNVKILTTDQTADQSATQPTIARSVTVEVSTDDAQKVALAQQLGTMYLLLRSAGDASAAGNSSLSASGFDKKDVVSASVATSPSILSLENEGPKYRSLVVTRGHTGETFSVIDEKLSKPTSIDGTNN